MVTINRQVLEQRGFMGFATIGDLQLDSAGIPEQMGVYAICIPETYTPDYINPGTGGLFQGRDPNVEVIVLENNWVEGADILYIGKAGALNQNTGLRERIRTYLRFGTGKRVAHRGGRYIWQLQGHEHFTVGYKVLTDIEPEKYERELLDEFVSTYERLPFANLI